MSESTFQPQPEKKPTKDNDFGKSEEGPYGCLGVEWKCLQCLNSIGWLTFFVSAFAALGTLTVNGALMAAISTIEKRFNLSSTESAFILTGYDLGYCVLCIPLEYLIRRANFGRTLGVTCMAITLACLMYSIPHFATDDVVLEDKGAENSSNPLCQREYAANGFKEKNEQDESRWLPMFIISGIITGAAMIPMWTVVYSRLEDQTTPEKGALNIAIMNAGSIIGPLVGIFGCSISLGLWVDLRLNGDLDVSPGDPNWVGAWWLPFFVDALFALVLFAFAFGFPNQFPGVSALKEERHRNNTIYQTKVNSNRSWVVKIQKVFFNPIWVLCTIAAFGDSFLVSALMGYGMKFIQEQYAVSATVAGIAGGLCAFGGFLGVLFPMIPIRVLKWEGWKCLAACSISSIALFVIYLPAIVLLPCGNTEFAGIFDGNGNPEQSLSLDQTCNTGCGCSLNTYTPVCNVEKKITYFSPCHAGCQSTLNTTFLECDCASGISLANGKCENDCSTIVPLTVCFIFVFFLIYVPMPLVPTAVLRTFDSEDKSFQMAVQTMFMRLFGTIPGPVIIGRLIDGTCVVWQEINGEKGACFLYDNDQLAKAFIIFPLSMKALATVSYILATSFAYKNEHRTNIIHNTGLSPTKEHSEKMTTEEIDHDADTTSL